ncbi:MAG: TetR/AcrR family transcriptional regulator [Acidobacteriia bacterium]|nr:TetR/AcrR family transcriptional regulator [Terriglobia bacterium]
MPPAKSGRHPYHHGNLKETLTESALRLIAELGPAGFTLREVARRAGVSHNAPYRHFEDKQDLLAALAADGFDRLTGSMQSALKPGSTPLERLNLAGRGYVAFALRWPQHFAVMFDTPLAHEQYPALAASGARAFDVLLGLVRECQAARAVQAGDPQQLALLAWSLVHGVAKLAIGGQLPSASKKSALEFCDFATRSLAAGIARR